jgi:hypothetical protein
MSHFSANVEIPVRSTIIEMSPTLIMHLYSIQVPALAKSMRIAGQLGSSALPPIAEASKEGHDTPFTAIGNKGAVALAKTDT